MYFSSVATERQSQWDFLIRYKPCLGEDWIMWGDMNDLLCEEEKLGVSLVQLLLSGGSRSLLMSVG